MKKHIQLETERTKFCREMYRPSSNFSRLVQTVITVLLEGQSPTGQYHRHFRRRK